MKSSRKALIVFMRYPESGRVKTRLAAAMGPVAAARTYEKLIRRTLGVVGDFKRERPEVEVFIYFTPPEKRHELEAGYPGPWRFAQQQGAHLGERMAEAIQQMMHQGHSQVVLVGTDLADLQPPDFNEAFQALENGYAALGPAADGGFYLIGLDRPCPSVFQSDAWGTEEIFARTEGLLLKAGFRVKRLKERRDIDYPEDVPFLETKPWFRARLSVIIPTLRPINRLAPSLQSLQKQIWPEDEIIVVQAETDFLDLNRRLQCNVNIDLTRHSGENLNPEHYLDTGFRRYDDLNPDTYLRGSVLSQRAPQPIAPHILSAFAPRGRGLQLNRGAALANGNLLFFLHDDSLPPPNFAYSIRKICEASDVSLGCFRLAFSPSTPLLDGIARWANSRTRVFGLPYGDQGLFCRRDIYEKAGGFKKPFLMEDVDFVRHCRHLGRFIMLPDSIATSPERYLHRGTLRASLRNHLTMLLYHLGVSDKRLYSFYYGSAPSSPARSDLPT